MSDNAVAPSIRPPDMSMLGRLDRADRTSIAGWAYDPRRPEERVALTLRIDGRQVGRVIADRYRADLKANGVGDGRHSFEIHLPGGLSRATARVVSVTRVTDGLELGQSPLTMPAEPLTPEQALAVVADTVQMAALAGDETKLQALLKRLAARVAELEVAPSLPQTVFLERWDVAGESTAGNLPPTGPDATNHKLPKRALFIDEAIPDPGKDAGSCAVLSHMRALQSLGFSVEFVPAWSPDVTMEAAGRLAALGVRVWHAPWIGSVEEVLRAAGEGLSLVYVHRHGAMAKYAALIRRWCPQARLVYCLADLHYLREARAEAVRSGLDPADTPMSSGVAALRAAEFNSVLAADAAITHSSYEAAILRAALPGEAVHSVPWVVQARPTMAPFTARQGVAFVGSYGHPPNSDAAWWLLDHVMPLVWAQDPSIRLVLAGSGLPDALRAHAANRQGPVDVLGELPELGVLWDQVRLSIAPLRFGAGLKGKVLDSLAAGVPSVCTPIAAEGMDLPDVLAAQSAVAPQELAQRVLLLHNDAALNLELREAGLEFIAARFNAAVVRAGLARAAGVADVGIEIATAQQEVT